MNAKKILIVDDEINIIELLTLNLVSRGYQVISCLTGEEAIRLVQDEVPDLIILDLMLPGIDGLSVCKKIKENELTAQIPIIMVTAKVEERDKIIGLELGADDYIAKPFSIMELITRVNVALRRIDQFKKTQIESQNDSILNIHDLTIDVEKHLLLKGNKEIEITAKEFKIILILATNHKVVFSRKQLIKEISQEMSKSELRSIDVHITNIRRKLGKYNQNDDYIETVRGVGYRMS